MVSPRTLQHGDLVLQNQDLGVLVVIAARQQTQEREHVRHTEVGQSKQHEAASSCSHRHRSGRGDESDQPPSVSIATTRP
jgi:hypothetical protein